MIIFIQKIILTIGKIYQSPRQKRTAPWFKINGDKTLRLDYNLKENSVVFDLGGYEGQWASDIYSRYSCQIHIFEPINDFADKIKQRFEKNNDIHVYKFGLDKANKTVKISSSMDGSSIYKKGGKMIDIKLVEINNFLNEKKIDHIDLLKINIEGSEYDLLEHLITTDIVKRISNIQVQFHDFIPNAIVRMNNIQNNLKKTHFLTYQYPFVWENWSKKIN